MNSFRVRVVKSWNDLTEDIGNHRLCLVVSKPCMTDAWGIRNTKQEIPIKKTVIYYMSRSIWK